MLFRTASRVSLSLLLLLIPSTVLARPRQVSLGASLVSEATCKITADLFDDLEELSRIVDIAYCVGTAGLGIQKPFLCASRCQDFKHFELVKVDRRVHCVHHGH